MKPILFEEEEILFFMNLQSRAFPKLYLKRTSSPFASFFPKEQFVGTICVGSPNFERFEAQTLKFFCTEKEFSGRIKK
ncbi:hypothetical protein A0128_02835 [Leptospira tipperaryensis]|uniref:Uncharacterized protein n=1 Tax=Leptospira tipperaryensis TaxID=2564040 RepID=A0A1D7UTM4_9LEPT|nr:hypothetical protein A0128_02835 [Leptospira tipperaryensis]